MEETINENNDDELLNIVLDSDTSKNKKIDSNDMLKVTLAEDKKLSIFSNHEENLFSDKKHDKQQKLESLNVNKIKVDEFSEEEPILKFRDESEENNASELFTIIKSTSGVDGELELKPNPQEIKRYPVSPAPKIPLSKPKIIKPKKTIDSEFSALDLLKEFYASDLDTDHLDEILEQFNVVEKTIITYLPSKNAHRKLHYLLNHFDTFIDGYMDERTRIVGLYAGKHRNSGELVVINSQITRTTEHGKSSIDLVVSSRDKSLANDVFHSIKMCFP